MTYGIKDLCKRYAVGEHTVLGWIRNGEVRKAVNVGRTPTARKPCANHGGGTDSLRAGCGHRSRPRRNKQWRRQAPPCWSSIDRTMTETAALQAA